MGFKLFIDTDVVIDFFTDRSPHVNPATELFELNDKGEVELFISAVSINNIYYVVKKYLGNKKAIEVIRELVETTKIVGTSEKEILLALENDFTDFEDSIQYSSALKIKGLDAILTRNIKDYRSSAISVMTPLNFLKMKDLKDTSI